MKQRQYLIPLLRVVLAVLLCWQLWEAATHALNASWPRALVALGISCALFAWFLHPATLFGPPFVSPSVLRSMPPVPATIETLGGLAVVLAFVLWVVT